MRFSHLWATFVAVSAFLVGGLVFAQGQSAGTTQQSSARNGTSVAVVDIKYIFDNHQRFKDAMDAIKRDYESFEAQVRETESILRKKIEELKAVTPGSDPFKQLEEEIAQTRTQVQLDISRKQKTRVEEEAKVYHRAYQEIEQQISKFADRYGIDLVLQFSTIEIDPSKPDTVVRGLNRLVVYQRNLNITKYVLDELNRVPAGGVTGGIPASGRPAAGGIQPGNVPPRNALAPGAPGGTLRK